jgi:hypothetical protein
MTSPGLWLMGDLEAKSSCARRQCSTSAPRAALLQQRWQSSHAACSSSVRSMNGWHLIGISPAGTPNAGSRRGRSRRRLVGLQVALVDRQLASERVDGVAHRWGHDANLRRCQSGRGRGAGPGEAVPGPVNVQHRKGTLSLAELAVFGVARVSVGPTLQQHLYDKFGSGPLAAMASDENPRVL